MSALAGKKMKGKDAEPAMEQFVTPVVTDEEERRLSRTMRSTDKLQDLMRFYYDMVPTVEDGDGVFVHHGKGTLLYYNKTPADYDLKDGDEIRFLPEISPRMFITTVILDFRGRQFTRTMRRTDKIQSLMNYYHAMVPTARYHELVFIFQGKFAHPQVTLAALGLEDGDEIDVFQQQPSWPSTPPPRLLVTNCAEESGSSKGSSTS